MRNYFKYQNIKEISIRLKLLMQAFYIYLKFLEIFHKIIELQLKMRI